ncbi:MAG: phosphoribosylglycinamide formyltransferase, partial [Oscillospiraceae bacterium]
MRRVAVLVSGGGTNLQALINARDAGHLPHARLVLVLSSNPEAHALKRAEHAGIPARVVARKALDDDAFDEALLQALQSHRIDLVVLAGFLSIVGPRVLAAYAGRIVNVHPSLIPAFSGPGFYGLRVHEAAL